MLLQWTISGKLNLSTPFDSVEKSIQVYKLESSIGFNDIKEVIDYVAILRQNKPGEALLDVGEATRFLFASDSGSSSYGNLNTLWVKFGWARRAGLPETLNAMTGRTEVLRLPSGVYLFEPAHFLIFEYQNNLVLLYEYNQYAPRPTRLCQYIAEFYRRMKDQPNIKVRIHPRRAFTRDVERLLRGYDAVKGIKIELEASAGKVLGRVLKESETVVESIFKRFGSKTVVISWRSAPKAELEITIDDVLNMFYELEHWSKSFVVTVKKGFIGRSEKIDLKKHALVFRKRIKLARDEYGNLLRSTDTHDAINVLMNTIDEVLNQL